MVAASIAFVVSVYRARTERSALALIFAAAAILAVTTEPPERPSAHKQKREPPSDVLTRVRARAARSIDRTFGDDAPLARALLIADQHQIPTEMRDRYAAALERMKTHPVQ